LILKLARKKKASIFDPIPYDGFLLTLCPPDFDPDQNTRKVTEIHEKLKGQYPEIKEVKYTRKMVKNRIKELLEEQRANAEAPSSMEVETL